MFESILVPLDGSEAAESALSPAFSLAQRYSRLVVLLRIVIPKVPVLSFAGGAPAALPTTDDPEQAEAQQYLRRQQQRWATCNVPIEIHVQAGVPAELIVQIAQQRRIDLIVMSTHGRSGLSRLVYGSVAEAVLRGAHTPLLLIPIIT